MINLLEISPLATSLLGRNDNAVDGAEISPLRAYGTSVEMTGASRDFSANIYHAVLRKIY